MFSLLYTSIDGVEISHECDNLDEARAFAHKWVGRHPEMGSFYAISGDGVGKIECFGCPLEDLFPEE